MSILQRAIDQTAKGLSSDTIDAYTEGVDVVRTYLPDLMKLIPSSARMMIKRQSERDNDSSNFE